MADGTPPPPPEAAAGARARLAARRAELLQRSAELRERLSRHGVALQPALAAADGVRQGWWWLRGHPWVLVPVAAALLWRRPRRLLVWAGLAWRGWRLWRRLPPAWRVRLAARMTPASTRG